MHQRVQLGIDIGATKTLLIFADHDGRVRSAVRLRTRERPEEHIEAMGRVISKTVSDPGSVTGIGVCCPGPVDPESRTVLTPPNIQQWRHFPLGRILEERYRCPVRLENDADAAGLAEHRYGAGRGARLMVYLTISSGVGSAIIQDGKIFRGAGGAHPELGHHAVDPRGRVCTCGSIGCLEAYISGRSIEKRYGVAPEGLEDLEAWRDIGFWLAIGLQNIAAIVAPQLIVVGGGVASGREQLLEHARAYLDKRIHMVPIPKVVTARLGVLAGGIGALSLSLEAPENLQLPISCSVLQEDDIA